MSPDELASKLLELLTDRVKRVQNREGGAVNVCQVSQEESIEKLVRRIVQDNLSEMELNASEKITYATLDPNTTRVANENQKEERLRRKMRALINYPDHFALESVKERWLRSKQLLKWIQDAISSGQLKDPGTPGCPVVTHGATNLSNAITIASEALRHCPRNNTSPAQNYAIVNYRRRGVPYVQAKPIKLFDKN
ncbi:hypothetical protein GLOIN_2v1785145 [Rhizophagus irregularis DAOM 181602=DAOM 197198]|nr:hypothetical protein GLOIN_2v1785145 [Rhizophagus irregularis DAOM 181602=DAOM 197198]